MDLLSNPFYILNACTSDNRQRIMELAEERSLLLDSNKCTEACSELTNPRKRLAAEIAWMPGATQKEVENVLSLLDRSPEKLIAVDNLSSMARTNMLASGLARLSNLNADDTTKWILEISEAFDECDAEELLWIINEERIISDFPEISDASAIEAQIQGRREYYRQAIKAALNNLHPKELIKTVTAVVETATENGEEECPIVIADIVDLYEIEAQGFLDKEEENIKILVEKLQAALDDKQPDFTIHTFVNKLIQVVKNWDTVAQPIQVCAKSRGLDHDASHRVAALVRHVSVHMFNEHDKLEFAQQLTNMLQEVFAEVGEIAERSADDANTLDEIAEQRTRFTENAKNSSAKWKKEITYEANVGVIFKEKLRISPEGIEWQGRRWDLNSITYVRWGGTSHSLNGIPTGTTYRIVFGNGSNHASISLRKTSTYTNFIDRLWKSVGIRLLLEYLDGLSKGKEYTFKSAIMRDRGMVLEHKRFFRKNQQIFCRWNELKIWSADGCFCIASKEYKGLTAEFSYQHDDNIHILEAAISLLLNQGGDKMSSLLTK